MTRNAIPKQPVVALLPGDQLPSFATQIEVAFKRLIEVTDPSMPVIFAPIGKEERGVLVEAYIPIRKEHREDDSTYESLRFVIPSEEWFGLPKFDSQTHKPTTKDINPDGPW